MRTEKKRSEAIFEKIVAENILDLMKDVNPQIKETTPKEGKKKGKRERREEEKQEKREKKREREKRKLRIIKEKKNLKLTRGGKSLCTIKQQLN